MAESRDRYDEEPDEEELEWLVKFARILLASVPQGFTKFRDLSICVYENKVTKGDYVRKMEEILLNYPQLRLAINTVNPHGRAYKLSSSKDLLEEWDDWKRKWTSDDFEENPTVYESHLFRCFLTIKAEINSMATENYAMVLEEKIKINTIEAGEMAAENALPVIRPPSPMYPPIDDNAIKKYFKSVKEIVSEDQERIYKKFKEILVAHGEKLDYPIAKTNLTIKLSKIGVCQEMCELLQDHKDILSDFIEFLPHIGHISRNVAEYDASD